MLPTAWGGAHAALVDDWRNFYYPTDPIAGPVTLGPGPGDADLVNADLVNKELSDPAECSYIYGQPLPEAQGHSGYWADPRVWEEIDCLASKLKREGPARGARCATCCCDLTPQKINSVASLEGYALAVVAVLACFFLTPWPVLAASVVVAPVAGYTMRQRQRLARTRGPRWQKFGTLLILAPCLIVFVYVAGMATWRVLYDVWLPHEMVTLQSGRVEVGYVLNDNSNWIPILRSGERRVRYRETQVNNRALCQLRPTGLLANRTAWQALGPHPLTAVNQPVCPYGFRGNP